MHFDSLFLLVLNLEDVLIVVFAAGSSDEDFVFGGSGISFGYFGEGEGFFGLFVGVVNAVYHLLGVHLAANITI